MLQAMHIIRPYQQQIFILALLQEARNLEKVESKLTTRSFKEKTKLRTECSGKTPSQKSINTNQ